jgi:hypothetical protein
VHIAGPFIIRSDETDPHSSSTFFFIEAKKDVDARHKAGHDGGESSIAMTSTRVSAYTLQSSLPGLSRQ